MEFHIPQEWLKEQVSVTEAEATHTYSKPPIIAGIPFGFANADWIEFKSLMQSGDELWFYSSPQESWDELMGTEGYVIIREGKIIAEMVTALN